MAKFTDVISGLTESTDPTGDSDYLVGYDTSAGDVVKILIDNLPYASSTVALDELAAPSDNTTLDSSTDTHGLMPKLNQIRFTFPIEFTGRRLRNSVKIPTGIKPNVLSCIIIVLRFSRN